MRNMPTQKLTPGQRRLAIAIFTIVVFLATKQVSSFAVNYQLLIHDVEEWKREVRATYRISAFSPTEPGPDFSYGAMGYQYKGPKAEVLFRNDLLDSRSIYFLVSLSTDELSGAFETIKQLRQGARSGELLVSVAKARNLFASPLFPGGWRPPMKYSIPNVYDPNIKDTPQQ